MNETQKLQDALIEAMNRQLGYPGQNARQLPLIVEVPAVEVRDCIPGSEEWADTRAAMNGILVVPEELEPWRDQCGNPWNGRSTLPSPTLADVGFERKEWK